GPLQVDAVGGGRVAGVDDGTGVGQKADGLGRSTTLTQVKAVVGAGADDDRVTGMDGVGRLLQCLPRGGRRTRRGVAATGGDVIRAQNLAPLQELTRKLYAADRTDADRLGCPPDALGQTVEESGNRS